MGYFVKVTHDLILQGPQQGEVSFGLSPQVKRNLVLGILGHGPPGAMDWRSLQFHDLSYGPCHRVFTLK